MIIRFVQFEQLPCFLFIINTNLTKMLSLPGSCNEEWGWENEAMQGQRVINLWLTARVKFYLSQENKCSHSQLWDMACWVSITIIKRFILVITLKVFDCHLNLFLMKACDRSSWVGSSGRHHCCHHSPPEEQHHHQPRILTPVSFLSSFIQFSPTLMFIYI